MTVLEDKKLHRDTYQQLIKVADELFYHQGYRYTSFSDIANAAGIAKGNCYYHFKTKDELLLAVIEFRAANISSELMQIEILSTDTRDALKAYEALMIRNSEEIARYGCPTGTLISELGKVQSKHKVAALGLLQLYKDFLVKQFMKLNHSNAEVSAEKMISWWQGVCTLTHAMNDAHIIEREATHMAAFINQLRPKH